MPRSTFSFISFSMYLYFIHISFYLTCVDSQKYKNTVSSRQKKNIYIQVDKMSDIFYLTVYKLMFTEQYSYCKPKNRL